MTDRLALNPRRRQPNVYAVIYGKDGVAKRVIRAKNLITTAGAVWYAQKATAEAVTNDFNRAALGTGNGGAWAAASVYSNLTGAIAGSIKAPDSTYPKRNDDDAANTGAGATVMTWRWTFTSTDFTSATAVTDGVITITGPVAGSAILCGFTLASSFTLATGESVKLFVNHTLTPV